MSKVLLLGMNNPLSDDPECDLYPYPEGSAGHRLWRLLPEGTTRHQYLDAFDRRNLLRAREWSLPAARQAARELLPALRGRVVVVLGTEVRAALGLPPMEPFSTRTFPEHDVCWVAFPHPSGRNRWFNQPDYQVLARSILAELYRISSTGLAPRCFDAIKAEVRA